MNFTLDAVRFISWAKKNIFLILFFSFSFFFIFFNLQKPCFWQDEAETALVAKTVLQYGVPKVTDGFNSYYQGPGKLGAAWGGVWAWTPWLQFYLAAFSIKLFGVSELAGRLPFALFGFITLLLLYSFSCRIFDRRTAFLSFVLLAFCVPFILYVRQCRYYALVIFFTMWAIQSIAFISSSRFSKGSLLITLYLLFHSNYMAWIAIYFSIFIYSLANPKDRMSLLKILFVSVLVQGPWFFFFQPFTHSSREISFNFFSIFSRFLGYLYEINSYVVPLILFLLIPLCIYILRFRGDFKKFSHLQKQIIVLLVLITLSTIGISTLGPSFNLRYLVGLFPVLAILLALLINLLWRRSVLIAGCIIVVVVFTNLLNIAGNLAMNFLFHERESARTEVALPLIELTNEIVHPVEGATKAMIDFLSKHAKPNDSVFITYGEYPIMFYTGLKVYGGLALQGLSEINNAKWVIPRKYILSDLDLFGMAYLVQYLEWNRYEKIDINKTDYPWENIPEPRFHQFREIRYDPKLAVHLYRRLDEQESSVLPQPPDLFFFIPKKKVFNSGQDLETELKQFYGSEFTIQKIFFKSM